MYLETERYGISNCAAKTIIEFSNRLDFSKEISFLYTKIKSILQLETANISIKDTLHAIIARCRLSQHCYDLLQHRR